MYVYSDHSIDANMYHHPYISYLKSEKIIIGISNIQFRFGHISFLQYVQSILSNNLLHEISLASINIIFYIVFIFTFGKNIFLSKKFSYSFLYAILFSSFLLIKYARYREYGNDLIPLLFGGYFLYVLLDKIENKKNFLKFSINSTLILSSLLLAHKVSYILVFMILLSSITSKNFNLKKLRFNYKKKYIFAGLIILLPWLIKNYLTTSCLIYPLVFTCFKNSFFQLYGLATPENAAWLTEIWSKSFLNHPDYPNIYLKEYASNFNWVNTWLNSHFIKIIEIISPLMLIFLLVTLSLISRKNGFRDNFYSKHNHKFFLKIFFLILIGLIIWFIKAPVYRFGAFYIITILILAFLIFVNKFFSNIKAYTAKDLKIIFSICLIFFFFKNFYRINQNNGSFFPKTSEKLNSGRYVSIYNNGLEMLSVKKDVCYYTQKICSHEIPKNLSLKKIGSFYVFGH